MGEVQVRDMGFGVKVMVKVDDEGEEDVVRREGALCISAIR